VCDIISGVGLGFFWPKSSSPGHQPQEESFSLKFLVELG